MNPLIAAISSITLGALGALSAASAAESKSAGTTGSAASYQAARAKVMSANPELRASILRGGTFSGADFSAAIANRMYSRTDAAAIADARQKLRVEAHGPKTWLLRLPFVNIVVLETQEGLVLIDSGYAPAGPALVEALSQLSDKPVHTVIFTHYHADHAFGAWALFAAGMRPRVIAQNRYVEQLEYDMKTAGLIARNNNQFPEDVPRSWSDAIRPTQTFDQRLTLEVGGEKIHLQHAKGETEDHLWVHVPSRQLVVTGDLFQDFLPNVGNGKRRVRFASDWAHALRAIAATNSGLLLPMHGPALTDRATISRRLGRQADMLDSIVKQVLDGLNAGTRQDLVVDGVTLAEEYRHDHDAREQYVTVKDIARMVIKEHSGWWDDIPSNWSPAPLTLQAEEIIRLSGGLDQAIAHAKHLSLSNSALAIKFADWIWLANPTIPKALRACLEIYAKHVSTPKPTQEALVYAEHMIRLELSLAQTERAIAQRGAQSPPK